VAYSTLSELGTFLDCLSLHFMQGFNYFVVLPSHKSKLFIELALTYEIF